MTERKITEQECGYCGADLRIGVYTRRISIVDLDLDCVAAWRCLDCVAQEDRAVGEVIAVADPAAFRESGR